MADTCANCGESIALELDGNGSFRWFHGEGADRQVDCPGHDEGQGKIAPSPGTYAEPKVKETSKSSSTGGS